MPNKERIKKLKGKYNLDIAAKFASSKEVGGDFWGAYSINEYTIAVYIIDISGYGLDSALSALRINTLLHANPDVLSDPGKTIKWLNKKLFKLFPIEQFSTMFYGTIDTKNNIFSYSAASSTSPIILRKGGFPAVMLPGQGYPLGVFKEAEFDTYVTEFCEGDSLILYSDALIEARKKCNSMFGEDGLLKTLEDIVSRQKGLSPEKIIEQLLEEFYQDCGRKLDDDLTINIYQRRG